MLRMKVKQSLAAAETLKKRMRDMNSTPAPVVSTSASSDNCKFVINKFPQTFSFIVDLKNDKELNQAYQHCLNGNQLVSITISFKQ
jgi:hypothetical protein